MTQPAAADVQPELEKPPTVREREKEALADALNKIARYERRDADGSLFDLVNDTADEIGDAIDNNPRVSVTKAENIARRILAKVKERKAQPERKPQAAHAG